MSLAIWRLNDTPLWHTLKLHLRITTWATLLVLCQIMHTGIYTIFAEGYDSWGRLKMKVLLKQLKTIVANGELYGVSLYHNVFMWERVKTPTR